GRADLEVVFIVTDAKSARPIKDARIAVRSEGGFHRERDEKNFELTTDADGIARRICHETMSFGSQSNRKSTDTYSVHLPWWNFQVSAQGYSPGDSIYLDVPVYGRQVEHVSGGQARLVVRIFLQPP